jgi:plasmid stabilization system protein ParE
VVVSRHLLFYVIDDRDVLVVRVLHGARIIERELKNGAGKS